MISKVFTDPHDEIGGDLVIRVSDQVTIEADQDLTVVHWIVGKEWNWGTDTKTRRYVGQAADVRAKLKEQMAVRIWQRPKDKVSEPAPAVELTVFDVLRIFQSTLQPPDAADD